MSAEAIRTTCPYCGVGCGVIAKPSPDGSVSITGDPDHPANYGRLCSKGSALGETLALDGRLLHPEIGGKRATWDAALGTIADTFARTIAEHGRESVAFYVSGQLLTEDYYAANKLMKGYIGTANIDTNSRLCMASSVAGHKRAFGADIVPGCYEDLEVADLVVLVGSNLAWCHPVLYQRLAAAREKRGTKIVVVDPRRTATCEIADMHLPIAAGSDVALFDGLLAFLADAGRSDATYVGQHTTGYAEALAVARAHTPRQIARLCGITERKLIEFFALFAATERAVTVYSQGVNQSVVGTDKVNAIINCHLATGRIGKPGMGPFSVTGQPNAMGGREVGGLANMLTAHMELEDPRHRQIVQAFWRSPRIAERPGHKAVEMFEAVRDGRIKAIWIMATNPAVSLPQAGRVREALEKCAFVVVSDVEQGTDTTLFADVLLPSAAWGEKDGTVTNSERRISRQRAFLSVPGEAKPDWWQFAEVAKRMGFDGFAWGRPADVFAEYAALTRYENAGSRGLDLSAIADVTADEYELLTPTQWPQSANAVTGQTRFFANGGFFTLDGRGRFVATPAGLASLATTRAYPFLLNTGRIRDQWHTMTRTAKAPRLANHIAEPFLEIDPIDAAEAGLAGADLAVVESEHGAVVLRVLESTRVRRGNLFAPFHWSDQYASAACIGKVIAAVVDPISGQPALKQTAVRIAPFLARTYGFAVSTQRPSTIGFGYWALSRIKSGWRLELADVGSTNDCEDWLARLWPDVSVNAEVLTYRDEASGEFRCAMFDGDRLIAALYLAATPVCCARTFLADQVGTAVQTAAQRHHVLAGRPGAEMRDRGRIVCACFDVGHNEIVEAISAANCTSVEQVGQATRAGTNCGSCRSEIRNILQTTCSEPVA